MDSKLLLINAIMLLYWESLSNGSTDSSEKILSIIPTIDKPEVSLDTGDNKKIIEGLILTTEFLCNRENKTQAIDKDILKQRLTLDLCGETELISIVMAGIVDETDDTIIKRKCLDYTSAISDYIIEKEFNDTIKRKLAELVYNQNGGDIRTKALSLTSDLEKFTSSNTEKEGVRGIPGVVDVINFDNDSELEEVLGVANSEMSESGIIKMGVQGINRLFGWHGGLRRGDFYTIAAFQHNFKSGLALKMFKWAALYNNPYDYMVNTDKTPMLLHVSSENSATDNLLLLYQDLYECEHGVACPISELSSPEERKKAARYIREKIGVNGYHVEMLRIDPSDFGYQDLFRLILHYESLGYEIHLLVIDYLNMLSKRGCTLTTVGSDTRDIFRRVRNFTSVRKISVITPHQIATDAKMLLRQDVELIVKEFPGKSYWDSCKTLDQEIDFGMWIHIEKEDGKSYLTIAWDKHRKSGPITPEEDKFIILPFHDIGSIRDDINKEDSSLKKLGMSGHDGGSSWAY